MSKMINAYFTYMKEPKEGLAALFASRSYGAALLGYLTAALAAVCVFNAGNGLGVFAFLFKTLTLFAAELLAGYLMAACAALFLDLSGKKAAPAEVFILIGTAGFIKGLLIAFAVIFLAAPALSFLMPVCVLLVLGLQLGYLIRNLMRGYEISGGRAFCALLFCALPALVGAGLAGVFFIWGLTLLF